MLQAVKLANPLLRILDTRIWTINDENTNIWFMSFKQIIKF